MRLGARLGFFVGVLISRILGYLRDLLLASYFGASSFTDLVVNLVFRVPNFLRKFLAEATLLPSVVALLKKISKINNSASKKLGKKVSDSAPVHSNVWAVLWGIFYHTLVLLLLVEVVVFIFPKVLFYVFFFKSPENWRDFEFIKYAPISFAYALFIITSCVWWAKLVLDGNTFPMVFNQALFNLVMIGAVFSADFHIVIWAALVGGALQLGYTLYSLKKSGLSFYTPSVELLRKTWKYWVEVVNKMFFAAASVGVWQIASLVDSAISWRLTSGSPTMLYLAQRLVQAPIGLVGYAISTADMSEESESKGSSEVKVGVAQGMNFMLRRDFWLLIFLSMATALLSRHLVSVLFFSLDEAVKSTTATVLLAYSPIVLLQPVSRMITQRLLFLEREKDLIFYAVVASGINIVLDIVLAEFLGVAGIALASSVALFIGLLVLRIVRGYSVLSFSQWALVTVWMGVVVFSVVK